MSASADTTSRPMLAHCGIERYRVLWLRDGKECQGPWFYSRERAHEARKAMAKKYGCALVYAD